MISIP
ncbi:hypothetical protein VCHC47A1_2485, partial [Vibrio cholerae HC-47A1]|jgi:hypothetical protein